MIISEKKAEIRINELKQNKLNIYFSIELCNCDYKSQINRFKVLTEKEKLLTILDPFGYIDLSAESIVDLIGKNKEILVTLMANTINRHKHIHKDSVLKTLRIKENELDNLDNIESFSFKFGDYLSKFNVSNIKPIYFNLKNDKHMLYYSLIFVTSSEKSYSEMYRRCDQHKTYHHNEINDEFEFSLYVWKKQPIDLNRNYSVEEILDTKIEDRQKFYLIKWKNMDCTWEKKNSEIMKLNRTKFQKFQNKMYEVEKVLNKKIVRGKNHYLIKWKGYDK